jgi:hypothetical protein
MVELARLEQLKEEQVEVLRQEAQKKLEKDIIKLKRHREAIEREIG